MGGGVAPPLIENVALTFFAADIVTMQVGPAPEQSPDQPEKLELELAVAVRVTLSPAA